MTIKILTLASELKELRSNGKRYRSMKNSSNWLLHYSQR